LEGRNSKIFGISGLTDVEIVNDPGTTKANNAAFPQFEDDTIEIVKAHPQTTFIFAHGIFMLQNDQGMTKLAGIKNGGDE